jgi:hypothetical protein
MPQEFILTADEREELTDLASGWTVHSARMAKDILLCVDEGILPPQESIEWFLRRFRPPSDRLPTDEELQAQLGELVAIGDMSCRMDADGEPRYRLTAQGLEKAKDRMREEGRELLQAPAAAWCLWNGRLLDLSEKDEELFRNAGIRLWGERYASGLNPVTGETRNPPKPSKRGKLAK